MNVATFTLVVASDPYKHEGIDSAIKLGEAILRKGHAIRGIFLYGGAVHALKKEISTGSGTRDIPAKVETFCKVNNVPVVGCTTWVGLAGLTRQDLIDGAAEEGLGDLATWVAASDKLVVFGPGA